MTRDEFKSSMSNLIDSIVPEQRELTDEDEDNLNDNLGEVAQEILDNDDSASSDSADKSNG